MRKNTFESIEAKIIPVPFSGCWLSLIGLTQNGYSIVKYHGEPRLAHRLFYEHYKGRIPENLTLDHLCRVRCCVNPDHLETVSHRENCLRGTAFVVENANKTSCINGHSFNLENTYMTKTGARQCRRCRNASVARWANTEHGKQKVRGYSLKWYHANKAKVAATLLK